MVDLDDIIFSYYNKYKKKYEKNLISLLKFVRERKYVKCMQFFVIYELNFAITKNKYKLLGYELGLSLKEHPLLQFLQDEKKNDNNFMKKVSKHVQFIYG